LLFSLVSKLTALQELQTLDTSQLVDLLAQHTANYSKMLSEGTTEEEYDKCKLTIKAIHAEIELRKKAGSISPNQVTDITTPPDFSK